MMSSVSAAEITIDSKTPGGLQKAIDRATGWRHNLLKKRCFTLENFINKSIKIIGKGSNVVLDGQSKLPDVKNIWKNLNEKVYVENIKFKKWKNYYSRLELFT